MMTFKSCTTFLFLLVMLEGSGVELTGIVRAKGPERTLGEVMELLSKGQQATEAEMSEMQSRLRRDPDDLDARTVLIGYYSSEQRESKDRDLLNTHLLWIIENYPDSVVAGTFYVRLSPIADGSAFWSAREAWLKHVKGEVQPGNAVGDRISRCEN